MPYHGGEVVIPDISLHGLLWERLQQHGNRTAIIDASPEGTSITYPELYDFSRKCAAYLQSQGIKKGDFVSICASGSVEFAYLLIGIMGSGAIVAPCNPSYRKNEILQQFLISRPRIVFVEEGSIETMVSVKEELSFLEQIVVIGESSVFPTIDQILKTTDPETLKPVDIDPTNDIAFAPHSSGTTGLPKCAMMTHKNYMGSLTIEVVEIDTSLSIYCDRPMYHAGGFGFVVSNLLLGMKMITEREFETDKMFGLIEKHRIAALWCVPPMLIDMINEKNAGKYDLSSLKMVVAGGAAISPEVIQQIMKKFKVVFMSAYGMTEGGGIAKGMVSEGDLSPATGKVIKGVELKITDVATEEECPVGKDGEIRIKSAQVTKGYLNNPAANAAAFDQNGWFRTGDVGHVDGDGNLYVVDRIKEIIKYKTVQISPAELEAVIIRHPKVADVGVVGIPDAMSGEVPRAFVVSSDSTLTIDEVHGIVNDNLVEYKHLRGGVEFVSFIPKSKTGKIQRNVLKKMAGF